MAPDIQPFKIHVSESAIESLNDKLDASQFPEETTFSDDWKYGTPLSDIKHLAQHWREKFNWRQQEAKLNEYPQYTTSVNVDGFGEVELHFLHQQTRNGNSIPLLFCHGWPGSFLEVLRILPLLTSTAPGAPSFHIVAPSLPNFGFSSLIQKPGFSIPQYAEALHSLMQKLGYSHYAAQGGDWGFIIVRMLAQLYPSSLLFHHLNFVRANPPSPTAHPLLYLQHALTPYTAAEKNGIERTKWFCGPGFAYNDLQAHSPHTIGIALRDSPLALLAWLHERLVQWTDNYKWDLDEELTWVSLYWFSVAGPGASARIYHESRFAELEKHDKCFEYNAGVLLGLSYFPRDLVVPPTIWGRTLGKVVFERRHADGGHFAAWERPNLVAGDLQDMAKRDPVRRIVEQRLAIKLA
ncbi:alpha/beta-hydrolase [Eremomyces bilateralis CBS 781.70]|uniref:Alpha/beta-hydrolase n=1 Tax=Eremomyces bilateralis CBS 781.70 TaxID=1392243 RepID=A0A6G1GHN8_9PEZI|nr:alpha/beta-hydrolase [Eremomyces bilateralis CBS 781.70]KAF1817466.1 alpha/beta-hydrolase [Eremomyces bilateralis CBS 781.70]